MPISYYNPKQEIRLNAYADTIVLEPDGREQRLRAIRFGGSLEMVRAMSDAIYAGATLETEFAGETAMLTCEPKKYECHLSHDGIYQATLEAFDMTLSRLGLRYLDLYLIHWPNPIQYRTTWQEATIGTWKAFEELYKAGRIRAIGVSNFMPHHIELLKEHCEILPMVNQLRLCPGVTQPEVVAYCKKNNILVEAYSPFGTGAIFKVPQMQQLAQKYGRSVGQICLRWSMQMGWLPLPKSANPDRVKENLNVFDFELEPEDVELIANLKGVCGEAPVPDEIHF